MKMSVEQKVDLDDILEEFGIFERYHLEQMILFFIAFTSNIAYYTNYIFVAEEVAYRCIDDLKVEQFCSSNGTQTCSRWEYDDPDSFFAYLACQEWKRTLVGTVHNAGYMCGLLFVGPMSDRFGRKTAAIITGVLGGVFGSIRSFSSGYWFYIVMEFLEAAIGDFCSPLYVLALEIVSTKKKLMFYMYSSFGFCFGGIVLAFVAWVTPNWRWLLRVLYFPAFLFIFFKYFLDESPRWLLTKGRNDEAKIILEKAARKNNKRLDKNILNKLSCEVSPNVTYGSLVKSTLKSKHLRQRVLVCIVWWTTSTFVNYGLIINSVSLEGNKYINFGLTYIVDVPATVLITYISIYFKRKLPLMLSFFAGGVLCISQPFLPVNLTWVSIVFYMAAKAMCTFYFSLTYLYTLELFPTCIRNSMHALCSSFGRVGSILAPQTPLLMVYWAGLPSLVFGLSAIFAGIVTVLVPDISNDSLPDTIDQAEELGMSKKRFRRLSKQTSQTLMRDPLQYFDIRIFAENTWEEYIRTGWAARKPPLHLPSDVTTGNTRFALDISKSLCYSAYEFNGVYFMITH